MVNIILNLINNKHNFVKSIKKLSIFSKQKNTIIKKDDIFFIFNFLQIDFLF